MPRIRLDKLLAERGLADGRGAAARLIETGRVTANGQPATDPGMKLLDDSRVEVSDGTDWVSRAALKLLAGLDAFPVDPQGAIALDVGASTGGFSQVLVNRGAASVTAVDVGRDQFHPALAEDPSITVFEGLDARNLTTAQISVPPSLVVCDASFISLKLVLPTALDLAAPGADLIALIKPQFEVGKGGVNKQGVVKSDESWQTAVDGVVTWMNALPHWRVLGTCDSPIHGPHGNREVLMHAKKTA